jgi:hypothetical protein
MKEEEQEAMTLWLKFCKYQPDSLKNHIQAENAKQCALICVDTILKDLENHDYPIYEGGMMFATDYWQKVKTEIEKL